MIKAEYQIINAIKKRLCKGNVDNISRTEFYYHFYKQHPEIRWALLASAVSRNAGWNMTDLESNWFKRMVSKDYRNIVFMTYERANWLIFEDAYPQLLIYEASKRLGVPLFHLLTNFHVSNFMVEEWSRFWEVPEIERLCIALIINEQHVIQKPVIDHPFYKQKVFHSFPFFLEDFFHYSAVIFPTMKGKLYGCTVSKFTDVSERIELGKRLMWLLFSFSEKEGMHQFLRTVPHTGSRRDFEKTLNWKTGKTSPLLRTTYGIVNHGRGEIVDWSEGVTRRKIERYFLQSINVTNEDKTAWYARIQNELYVCLKIEEAIVPGHV